MTEKKKIPHLIDKHVGSRVRMRRLMLGLTQQKLGKKLGVTFQQLQKYEKGTNRISASRMLAIAEILQVPAPFFFEGAPGVEDHLREGTAPLLPSDLTEFFTTADGLKLVSAFPRIGSAELRRSIVRLVEGIVGESDG